MTGKATITVIGRVARDPEARYTQDGKAVCSFSIPVQERKDGDTTWYKITAWEKQAEVINQYVTKGTWLAVTGVPKVETWEDKNTGETRAQLSVTLREFTFCGGGEQQQQANEAPAQPQRPAQPAPPAEEQMKAARRPVPNVNAVPRNRPVPVDETGTLPF